MTKIPLELRKKVYERDNYLCQFCGEKVILTKDVKTEEDFKKEASLDHIIPLSKNGKTEFKNLQTACRGCNSRKKNHNKEELKFLSLNRGGYTRIHTALLNAFARTKLNSQESRVLFAIIAKTYGYQKSKDWISNSQLEKLTGIHRCHCSRTISRLIKRKIVTKTGNKKIKFSKYFFNWRNVTKTGNKLPKQASNVTNSGNRVVPKLVTTKDNITKDNIKKIYKRKKYLVNAEFIKKLKRENDKFKILDIEDQLEKWKDWKLSKGKIFKNNQAAFRNWLRKALDFYYEKYPNEKFDIQTEREVEKLTKERKKIIDKALADNAEHSPHLFTAEQQKRINAIDKKIRKIRGGVKYADIKADNPSWL